MRFTHACRRILRPRQPGTDQEEFAVRAASRQRWLSGTGRCCPVGTGALGHVVLAIACISMRTGSHSGGNESRKSWHPGGSAAKKVDEGTGGHSNWPAREQPTREPVSGSAGEQPLEIGKRGEHS